MRFVEDRGATREDERTLERVPELADVARPRVALHEQARVGMNLDMSLLAVVAGAPLEERAQDLRRERQDVFDAVAEGGHVEGNDGKTIVEVAPESALGNGLLEINVRRGD